jgi:hypothetical protein
MFYKGVHRPKGTLEEKDELTTETIDTLWLPPRRMLPGSEPMKARPRTPFSETAIHSHQ